MADETWHVIFGEWGTDRESRSWVRDTKEMAQHAACDHIRNRDCALRVESSLGKVVPLEEINSWCKQHPVKVNLRDAPVDYTGPLPTVGHDRAHGVKAIRVYCRGRLSSLES
jgi:hypothetical protein